MRLISKVLASSHPLSASSEASSAFLSIPESKSCNASTRSPSEASAEATLSRRLLAETKSQIIGGASKESRATKSDAAPT